MLKHAHEAPQLDRALVWLRRDLRLHDQAALHHALHDARQVWCAFVFDREILDPLPRADRRVEFIRDSVVELDAALSRMRPGARLIVRHGMAREELPRLAQQLGVQAVYTNHDDEPVALQRDAQVLGRLADHGIAWRSFKDHVVFERSELLTGAGTPFSVFTPYKKAWLKRLGLPDARLGLPDAREPAEASPPAAVVELNTQTQAARLAPLPEALAAETAGELPTLAALGFEPTNLHQLRLPTGISGSQQLLQDFLGRIDAYDSARDYPAIKGPSYLSTHLRFGTLSIREAVRAALAARHRGAQGAETWLSELIWRDFYHQILHHHPHVVGHAFKPAYEAVRWEHGKAAERAFAEWCAGRTGYPLVDAAMAQLNQSGYMHNRLRMVVASFLTKDLGLDWRWGERYFAEKLNDFDLASNNGGWQWAASTGCDAQPWFRIFNPVTQSQKFDPQGHFIRRYLPQLANLPDEAIHAPWLARPIDLQAAGVQLGTHYPKPMVDHEQARQRTLARFAPVRAASGEPRGREAEGDG